jgi:hypothetical protein
MVMKFQTAKQGREYKVLEETEVQNNWKVSALKFSKKVCL